MGLDVSKATFDSLVLRHLPACERFAVRLAGDVDEAEEVLQEAMVRATKFRASYRGEAAFQTWVFRIVLNAWHDRLRRRGVGMDEMSGEHAARGADEPGVVLEGKELSERVARAVSGLPPRQREVVVMTAYEGMSVGEVAEALGVSEQNVRTNLHYGRVRLKDVLRAYLPEAQRHE